MPIGERKMKNFEIRIQVDANSIEDVEDWFCGTIMGEIGVVEVNNWSVEEAN